VLRALVSPRLVGVHLLGLVATTLAVLLGLWQYDAWQAGRQLEARDLANAAPRPLEQVITPDQPYPGGAVGQPVTFRGEWLEGETFYVAGREHEDRVGYWVVTPVAVAGTPTPATMLVVRGWSADASQEADPSGQVAVTGWLQPSEGSGRPDDDLDDAVIPEMRVASVVQRLDRDLYGAYVIGDVASTRSTGGAGLEPVTPDSLPEPATTTALRNLLYALEWWVFAAFAAFIWWRWVRDELASTGSTTEHGSTGDEVESAGDGVDSTSASTESGSASEYRVLR